MATIIICIIAVLIVAFLVFMAFTKKKTLAGWLLLAVEMAEAELGGGTGPAKLTLVYSRLVTQFPIIGKFIPMSLFMKLVDKALDIMREQLKKEAE